MEMGCVHWKKEQDNNGLKTVVVDDVDNICST